MTAIEKLTKMNETYQIELKGVREQYNTLTLVTQLTRRHGLTSVEDAMHEEARQRCRRNQWAELTK